MRVIAAGTRVRIKTPVCGGPVSAGTLMRSVYGDSFAQVMCDCGLVACTGSELAVLRDQAPGPEPMRYRLPYGLWTCAEGREVLFNRDYKPIWQRRPGEAATAARRDEWVPWLRQEWFYDDHDAPWLKGRKARAAKASVVRCEAVLTAWGVVDLLRLISVQSLAGGTGDERDGGYDA